MTNQSEKIRVAVLFGGRSAEHEVSVQSAKNVVHNLDMALYDVTPIGIDKQGNWLLGHDVFQKSLEDKTVNQVEHKQSTWFTPEWVRKPADGVKDLEMPRASHLPQFDVVFPAMHGSYGEDGSLQGLLELADMPYVGPGVLGSSVGMDKDVSKRLAVNAGINVAPFIVMKHGYWKKDPEKYIRLIEEKIDYPVFVKPSNTGSSIGISKVVKREALTSAIEEAFRFDTKVLIEKALKIQELEVAVLESLEDGGEPIVSEVGEIKSNNEFYSYDAKYLDENGADLFIPANVSKDVRETARAVAKELFIILECEGMARVDLFYDLDTQEIYFNEINTLPGFTKISMYPKLMEASGKSYKELLTHLVQLAIKRHQSKSKLCRNFAD